MTRAAAEPSKNFSTQPAPTIRLQVHCGSSATGPSPTRTPVIKIDIGVPLWLDDHYFLDNLQVADDDTVTEDSTEESESSDGIGT
ncbi:hypothetical protein AJ79_09145 [Helicocarpus griseus UAMH5409]|uniref:Uncharacterized protein n=1 Tax=Helicocarpus griseus UAMH5409 TaxID=1447875 RepID=A0A2B7WLT3_9EURO|nr:hypothetical protein AJ79_09145 [Helicocarpus griseus UAMH5409]